VPTYVKAHRNIYILVTFEQLGKSAAMQKKKKTEQIKTKTKPSTQGERARDIPKALLETPGKGTQKLAFYCKGTLLPQAGSSPILFGNTQQGGNFFFCENQGSSPG
jgi:hypothetical protein